MKAILRAFLKYLLQLAVVWFLVVLFYILDMLDVLDTLGVVERLAPGFNLPERQLYLLLLAISFVMANPIIYIKQTLEKQSLENRIAEFEATEANILLELAGTGFSPSGTGTSRPFPEVKVDSYGFDEHGLPGWGVLWVSLKGENIGWEAGIPVCEFNRGKTELPSLFDPNFVLDKGISDEIFWDASRRIEGRTPFEAYLRLNVRITERDPQVFARSLNSLKKYRVVINYYTKPIVGKSEPHVRSLPIEGDFQEFRQQLLEYWRHSKYRELAQIAETNKDDQPQLRH